ncbi:MAG: hypothetical protein Q9167_005868 [Letrouitia subvulpina]
MAPPTEGIYNIQRTDNQYLAVVGNIVTTSPDAYKWTIVPLGDGHFRIQDLVTLQFIYDNEIYNVATSKSLAVPYTGTKEQKWTAHEVKI